jgi:hypothetical protein
MTATIQIGNSDDKLTQAEWCEFVAIVAAYIERHVEDRVAAVHFFAASPGEARWQNAAWVIDIADEHVDALRFSLRKARVEFRQESIALTLGKTEFVA